MNLQPYEVVNPVSPSRAGDDAFLKRVLVAEDDPLYRHLLARMLSERGFLVDSVADGTEPLKRGWAPGAPRLIILDWMMPGLCGPDICRQLRRRSAIGYQYIILLSANDKKADVVAGLEAGADDYLTKPFDSHELLARIHVGLRMVILQNSLFAAQERLRFQATHDSLTGIWNRGAMLELMAAQLERARRAHTPVSALMLDIDHFKQVNDDFGHQTGDSVLCEVARRLAATVRVYDTIGRYGGEEFLVVAELDPDQAREYAERLRACVAKSMIEIAGHRQAVSVSIGVATSDACNPCKLSELIYRADTAMYSAKREGRNRVEVAD
jgi:two-component system, cell cycle response regulator